MMKKAVILTWNGFQDQEVIYPYYRLLEDGFSVGLATDLKNGSTNGDVVGLFGIKFPAIYEINDLKESDFDFLVLPGGVKALEKLRQHQYALTLIHAYDLSGGIIASTCHGAQLLISAKVVYGRRISGYYSIMDDIRNAGAIYVDEPAVVDTNIISSPHYKHMGPWMKTALNEYHKY
jgi:protease I